MKIITGIILALLLSNSYAIYPEPVKSTQGMVVTEQALASIVGANILKQGGNAIDAAVAVGYALAVTQPCCGNIGGGGFMLIHLAEGKNVFINFREKAPLKATANMFLDEKGNVIPDKSLLGFGSVAVPGTVMGLDHALQKYGSFNRQQVMQPAIDLAREGFVLMEADANQLSDLKTPLSENNFMHQGKLLQAGQKVVQMNLAKTLDLIVNQGVDVFYKGVIAEKIVKAAQGNQGYLSLEDFAKYTIQELEPLTCQYKGYTIITAPPPSSGGVALCEMLAILEGYELDNLGYHSAQSVHYITEAMRYAFADSNNKLGDPDFVNNPVAELISPEYAAKIRENIQKFKASLSPELPSTSLKKESIQTTHYSIADKAGNLVAVTYTLNGMFGAQVIAGDTGFFLNNQMDDFTIKEGASNQFGLVQGKVNAIEPGKRPVSSMTPAMVFRNKDPVLVLGGRGGPKIITAVLQIIIHVLDYGMDIKTAVDEPRFHHQWLPDYIDMEAYTFSQDTLQKLAYMGYRVRTRKPLSVAGAIYILRDKKGFLGASDDRGRAGLAVGVKEGNV